MHVKCRISIAIVLVSVLHSAWAQLPLLQFETITTRDGLPSSTVLCGAKDKDGFMWFGTRLCPVRYDGATFQSFLSPETNLVSGLAVDRSNNVWLSSDPNGIAKIEQSRLALKPVLREVKEHETGFFYIDKYDHGWYSDFHGVNRVNLKTQQVKHYPLRQSTYVWAKASFVEDSSGTLWVVGRDNGLFRYDREKDTLICEFGKDSGEVAKRKELIFAKACSDADGFLWLATVSDGLIRYNTKDNTYKLFGSGRENPSMLSVASGTDENGEHILWIGHQDGLGIFRPDQENFYYFENIFPVHYEVNDIYRDPDSGIVWACTSSGIIKYHPKTNFFKTIHLPDAFADHAATVNAVVQDRYSTNEIYFMGLSHTGMLRWDRTANTFQIIPYPEGRSAETRWMTQQKDGTLWIGTHRWDYLSPGLFVYDTKQQRFINTAIARLAHQKFSVPFFSYGRFDDQGKLWTGNAEDGLSIFDEREQSDVTPWTKEQQRLIFKNNSFITDIRITKNRNILVGTKSGVFSFDSASKTLRTLDHGLHDSIRWRSVNSLLEDSHGNIWAARWGSLTQMSPEGRLLKMYSVADGLFDQECHGLVEDASGNIWMGNYEGLYYINPATGRLIRFTMNDGLMSNNTAGRVFISNNGSELIIGHQNGFNIVKISKSLTPMDPPHLAISSFKVHGKTIPIDIGNTMTLERDENAFSVDFIALNYRKEQDNQYAFYLEGFDRDWNYSGTRHSAYYTNLSPGTYILHMKAGDSFGNWNNQTIDITIIIAPAFYETWWFEIMVAVAAVGILYGLYRIRVNQLLRLQMMRNRISADLHDELGSSLSSIGIMGKLAQNKLSEQHPSAQFVDRIVEEAQQMSGSLDDIVWNISPKNDALSSMVARMTRYASEVFEAKKIVYNITMPEHIEEVTLSMEQRRNMYLIFKEAVNNVVKHSHCTFASVTVTVAEKKFQLVVHDNGVGFDQSIQYDRNGLVNLQERASMLNGNIEINSKPGRGSSIKLIFPLRSSHPKGLLNNS